MAPTISQLRSDGPSKMGNCQVSWSINNECISLKGVSIDGEYIWVFSLHFTTVLESGFLDPGHNRYRRSIFIMLFLAPSPVPDFLFWSIFPYCIPIFFLSSTGVFH